ncbi:hypothetical protein BS47DRAFT_1390087 [Hydnum rufescens UP504]|uniref:DNA-directed RNA polymerase III subunit RPC9 n=1 Tax=Hydnum rufescens UP504 TaxID=1448309 RepID=A0A9P6B4M3_9AGAM|nr:hypothetical protein BS47DRAFT_1390087 [Hydnum rufescens UP504]
MEVLVPRSALLSNFEVLRLLKELEAEQLVHARAALVKKEGEEADPKSVVTALGDIVSENMRTVQFEVIEHLSTPPMLTTRQDEQSVAQLLVQLQVYELTKIEKLQIVNLLPTHAVELYVVIEEFEERFSMDDMEAMLEIVRNHVKDSPTTSGPDDVSQRHSGLGTGPEPIVGDGHGGQDGWEAPDEFDELMDGPRYGEYEDDLGEDANDDD